MITNVVNIWIWINGNLDAIWKWMNDNLDAITAVGIIATLAATIYKIRVMNYKRGLLKIKKYRAIINALLKYMH